MKAIQIVLLFLTVKTSSTTMQNVALRGVATQSDRENSPYSAASNAIDGNSNPIFSAGSCSATKAHDSPWWRLDLLEFYRIYSIVVVNRGDCCEDNLDGAEIRLGNILINEGNDNYLVTVLPHISSGQSYTFTLPDGGMEARYVNVRLPCVTRSLVLCEVEVYGFRSPRGNLALCGVATQSSQEATHHAYNAIDGNTISNVQKGSCTHTKNENQPWWRLDLKKTHRIFMVNVYNREGSTAASRLDGAQIIVGNSLDNNGNNNPVCDTIGSIPPGDSKTYSCNGNLGMDGRYLNIFIPGRTTHLHVCEVEVFGFAIE